MRVAIDATAIGSGLGGDETLVAALLRGLAAMAEPGDVLRVLAAPGAGLPGELDRSNGTVLVDEHRRGGGPRHFGTTLPSWLHRLAPVPEVVLTNTHAPLRSPAPVALTVPDLSFHHRPDHYPTTTRLRLTTLVPRQARRSAAVLTISDFCRADLVSAYRLDPAAVHVVPLTIGPVQYPDDRTVALVRTQLVAAGVTGPYLLALGNLHPRKNVARTIRAFEHAATTDPALAGYQLVIAGGRWWRGGEEDAAAAGSMAGSVVFLGRVDDPTREVLLRDATALVYASLFEGFGLPPLEAMARGTAVIASATTAIPEVCGDAALLVDPTETVAIAEAMCTVVGDARRRHALERRGIDRSERFTVAATAAALATALTPIVAGHAGGFVARAGR